MGVELGEEAAAQPAHGVTRGCSCGRGDRVVGTTPGVLQPVPYSTYVAGNGGVRSSGPEVKLTLLLGNALARPFYTQLHPPARFERRRGRARQHLNSYFWMKFRGGT
jgi:hypothetical protein